MKIYKSNEPCVMCGENRENMVCYHHIYSRKSHPEFKNELWNMIPVCQKHHNFFHAKGNVYMFKNFYHVKKWLIQNKWELINGKLYREA